jgi:hypothetical protein
LSEGFHCSVECLQTLSEIREWPSPSTLSPVYHSPRIPLFDGTLLTAQKNWEYTHIVTFLARSLTVVYLFVYLFEKKLTDMDCVFFLPAVFVANIFASCICLICCAGIGRKAAWTVSVIIIF